jgi:predicted amidohydrolase YtcJ
VGEYSSHILIFAAAEFSAPPNEVRVLFLRSFALSIFAMLLCGAASSAQRSARIAPADILIVHAKIYTVDEKKPWAQSLAIRNGKIVAVGSDAQVERFRGIGTKVIDAGAKLVLPAFTDSHIHMTDGGFLLIQANSKEVKSTSQIQGRPRGCTDQRSNVPPHSHVENLNALRAAMKWANQNGIARVHSTGGDFEQLDALQELRTDKQLSVRFHIAYKLEPPELRAQDIEAIETARKKFHDDWINVNSVKFFLDGSVESHTAALLESYSDMPFTKGALLWDPDKCKSAVAELDKRGLQLYAHATGDYAVRTALDAYELAESKNHTKDHRNRVEHVETVSTADIPRFGKLDVIASMQPLGSYPDDDILDIWARNIGSDRASRAWAWKSIAQHGAHFAFGSDWPFAALSPWEGIQTVVTRQTRNGKPATGFVPSQKLTVAQAVEGYTIEAAYAGHLEKSEGSLETGKVADVIILDRNILEIDPHTINLTKVLFTIVGGKIVYESDTR